MVTKSVQVRPQYEESPRSSYVINLASIADDITPWGYNPYYRDIQLRNFWPTEPFLASGIYTIVARNAAFNWTLDGPLRTVRASQDMLHQANLGGGWLEFITMFSIDFFTADNGAFIEVIRGGNSWNAPVLGIAHLDSGRCRRTGVPDWPVVYTDRNGAEHKMRPWQVIACSEFPSPIETMNGVGLCAVSRVLRFAQLMRDIAVYKREKVSGNHSKQIHVVSGIRTSELEDSMKTHREEQEAQGFIRYIKPLIFGTLDPTAKVEVKTIDLAALPDGFNEEVTLKWYISLLAMGFGADYQDFAPLPGGGLGSSQQSQILHQKSRGKGPALFMKMLEHKFNFYGVIPQNVTFRYDEQDTASEMEQATLEKVKAETRNIYVLNGTLTSGAARQQMLDDGYLTQEEFDALNIMPDITPEVMATDSEPAEGSDQNVNADKAKIDNEDFMDSERRKAESLLEKDISKSLQETYADIKKRILSTKEGEEAISAAAAAAITGLINDEALWNEFRVRMVSAAQPHFRKGALDAAAYNATIGLVVDMDLVNQSVLDFTKSYTNAWWEQLSKTTRDGLRKSIEAWQETGLGKRGLPDLIDSLEPLFGEARAKRIAVTETTRVFDEGNRLSHESAGIENEEFQTAADDLVCPICSPLNGKIYKINEGPRPPLHINCRCQRPPAAN